MSLAATLCSAHLVDGIHADGSGVLIHNTTFMANPLACAVALASIELLLASDWQVDVVKIEGQLNAELKICRQLDSVADVGIKGAIGVIEMHKPIDVEQVQQELINLGVWLRPFGKLLYTMPPLYHIRSSVEPNHISHNPGLR